MKRTELPLVLASGSPRRKEILETMGLEFIVDVSQADENTSGAPASMVMELSRRKAEAVAGSHDEAIILAADTLVFCDGSVLGKPGSAENARIMLEHLSGKWHEVYTGVTLINTKTAQTLSRADCTRVHFVEMSSEDIAEYVASGEPIDKAGSYGIQGMGGMFIDRIEGSYSNVVGLPMAMLRSMLCEITNKN